ncbi:hypothetical protein NDU88_004123 [Pleurodeles waltl]|uniref:Uncharacterized protein n=1 Tax=Pleurodeles waltl TaxID=8319 RepID=A0AAV7V0C0_PLEWA|nr:hypothetical protein NDU88_004123 [Pleurodeles waltl]
MGWRVPDYARWKADVLEWFVTEEIHMKLNRHDDKASEDTADWLSPHFYRKYGLRLRGSCRGGGRGVNIETRIRPYIKAKGMVRRC